MDGLANIFEVIGTHPLAKWIAAAFALRAIWSLVSWRRTAMGCARPAEALELVEMRRQAPWRHSARFCVVMVAGIGLSIAGLVRLASVGGGAPMALAMLMVGMYLFMTEPVRQQIADAEDRVALTAEGGDPEARALSLSMLRDSHLSLVMIEVGAALALGLAILALSGSMNLGL